MTPLPVAKHFTQGLVLVAAALSMVVGSAVAADGYSYTLIARVSQPEFAAGRRLCSFALNNLGQVAYMTQHSNLHEVWLHDGTGSHLVHSSNQADAVRLSCHFMHDSQYQTNVGLRDDGLVSFGLKTSTGVVLLGYGRAGLGIEGTVENPLGPGLYFIGPTINAAGRTGFVWGVGGHTITFGTAEGSIDGTTAIRSSATTVAQSVSLFGGRAAAINDRNQAAIVYRDNSVSPHEVMLGFSDPSAAPGSQTRFLRLGPTPEFWPRTSQPSLNELGVVALTSDPGGADSPSVVLAIDAAEAASPITVADTTSGRFDRFHGVASINESNQVAFMAFIGAPHNDYGVYVGSMSGTDPIDVLLPGQLLSMPGLTTSYAGIAGVATQSLNDSGQVLFLARTDAGELLVLATPLSDMELELKQSEVAGCKSTTGTVALVNPAPPGGQVIVLSDTLASATVPASVTIPAGASSARFTIKTTSVAANESGFVSASLAGASVNGPLTVRPMGLKSITLTPSTIAGSNPVVGKATLECKAGPGPITVSLASSNPAAASPVAASMVVPQGLQSTAFNVGTSAVLGKTTAMISGTANGITKSKKLTVTPAASLTPTRLNLGNVRVGTVSGALSAVLSNKGAVDFSVNSVSLTGTYASWFAQSNDCPPSLASGASCTISVTFAPTAALRKSAKLSIATSATSGPIGVSLSGTGVP